MKKLALLVALVLAFSFAALAQTSGTTGAQGTTTPKASAKSKAGATAGEAGTAAPKEHQLTGCLEKNAAGTGYTLKNAHYKNGVDVTSSEDLSAHVGHKVKLMGDWKTPGKEFSATGVKHIADTCTAGGKAGGKMGAKTSKKGAATATPNP